VSTTFRYGREEDEVMGLKFSKEMVLCKEQVVPKKKSNELTALQLGENNNVFPFMFRLPDTAPPSVTLQPGEGDAGKPLGVEYELKAFVADNDQDPGHRRSTVSLRIRKVQFAALTRGQKQPSTLVSKGFTFSPGKINLEVTLDRDIYYHGEDMAAQVQVNNTSKKSVRSLKVRPVIFLLSPSREEKTKRSFTSSLKCYNGE
jgi:arrestin-2